MSQIEKIMAELKLSEEQSAQLTKAIETDQKNVVTEATTPTTPAGNQGDRTERSRVTQNLLGFAGPLASLFFSQTLEPVYLQEFEADYLIPNSSISNSNRFPGESPVETALVSKKAKMRLGKKWKFDKMNKEDTMEWRNIQVLNNRTLDDGSSSHPANQVLENISYELARECEADFYNGTPSTANDANLGRGIAGIKTQHNKLNTTASVAGNNTTEKNLISGDSAAATFVDANWNKVFYENNAAGLAAWAQDALLRISILLQHFAVDHCVILCPMGSATNIRAALTTALNQLAGTTFITLSPATGVGAREGQYAAMFSDLGRFFVNDRIDVVELTGGVAQEVIIVPDRMRGRSQFGIKEFCLSGQAPRGFVVGVQHKGDQNIIDFLNGSGLDWQESNMEVSNVAEGLAIGVQWTGQIVLKSAALSVMYTQCAFAALKTFATFNPTVGTGAQTAAINIW